jgi:hypothetical protein
MHPHLMNVQTVDELEQRFADDGYARTPTDPVDRTPADPAHQAAIANCQECSLAEWMALQAETRKEILERLDAWRAEDTKREAILIACICAGKESARRKGLNQSSNSC